MRLGGPRGWVTRDDHVERASHRIARGILLLLPLVVLVERAWARRWVNDDGFLNLRVVSLIKAGHGPVFNAGERVEAATSPLWIFVLTVADLVAPIRLEWIAVILGIALSITGLALAIAGSIRLIGRRPRPEVFVPAGAAVWVALVPVWKFSSSGLEGGLAFAWIGSCLWILATWARGDDRLPVWGAATMGLGPLIRPELALFTAVLLVGVLVAGRHDDDARDRVRLLVAVLALPVAYQIFRMGYYGSVVPNPGIAKEGVSARWSLGWRYVRSSTGPYVLWLPLVLLAVGAYVPLVRSLWATGHPRVLAVVAMFAGGGLLQVLYVVRVGGDFMHARLLLPALFTLTVPVAVVPLRRDYALAVLVIPWAVASILFLRADADDFPPAGATTRNPVTLADYGYDEGGPQRAWFDGDGVYYVTKPLPARTVGDRDAEVATYGVGVAAYAFGPDVYVLDLLGLGDAFTSHLELDRRGFVGHEKPLPSPWIVARLTPPGTSLLPGHFPVPGNLLAAPLDDPDQAPFAERVERARAALRCSVLCDFEDSYTAALTPGRFLSNVVHAVGNTRLRIPPEPEDAYTEFCEEG